MTSTIHRIEAARPAAAPVDAAGSFLLRRGASGRLYVFSPVAPGDDLDGAVTLCWPTTGSHARLWAHWLAATPEARRKARADLARSTAAPSFFEPPTALAA